jgi:hypothetical protein
MAELEGDRPSCKTESPAARQLLSPATERSLSAWGSDLATLERRVEDAQAAYARVQQSGDDQELREIQDDLAYLRVKARRGETISTSERRELGARIDRFMTRLSRASDDPPVV